MLHIDDLFHLLTIQIADENCWNGQAFHVGGGPEISSSLLELTDICNEVTGKKMKIGKQPETSHVDLRIFITDGRKAMDRFQWAPQKNVVTIVKDIHEWIVQNRAGLEMIFSRK